MKWHLSNNLGQSIPSLSPEQVLTSCILKVLFLNRRLHHPEVLFPPKWRRFRQPPNYQFLALCGETS